MKFVKLTAAEFKRDDSVLAGAFCPTGPVLINLEQVLYIDHPRRGDATCLTFMDHENQSCCVYVMEPFEEVRDIIEGRKS